jgi:putative ABC transport system permease protein
MNNHLRIFIRNFLKHKISNLLSIGGLSLGIAIALLLGWWSLNELNYDSFNRDADSIYRVTREGFINNESVKIGTVFAPLCNVAANKYPQIKDKLRITTYGKMRFEANHIVQYEEQIYLADSNFFDFFDYKIKIGDPKKCFSAPNYIVITEDLANKYFPYTNPIGESVNVYDRDWEISAVMYNTPNNSHLKFDAMACMSGVPDIANSGWGNRDMYGTYFKLPIGTNTEELATNINALAKESFPFYKQMEINHFLQPLKEVHFATESFRFDYAVKSDKRFVMIFLFMAIAILVIACINFTNLFISTSFLRAKSIGVKKTNGANKASLIKEFFAETSYYVTASVTIGVFLAVLFVPLFNQLVDSKVTFDYSNPIFYILLIAITIATIAMAGTFPALYITKFDPATTLKGKFNGKNVSALQKGLVIMQFAASIILLITVVTIKKQVHFIQNTDLGFDKSNTLYVDATGPFATNYNAIKQELERNPDIIEVTAKSCIPSDWNNGNPISIPGQVGDPLLMENCQIVNNYTNMLEIDIVEGENFENYKNSKNVALLNEQAVKVLGLENPIGAEIIRNDERLLVVGVLEDIKSKSLHSTVDPQVYLNMSEPFEGCVLMIKTTSNTTAAINAVKEKWIAVNPEHPFEFHFLDEAYEELYKNEIRAGKIVTWGMGFAMFITMIGLFAMARYSTERRTKEIGVRQVNGAKIMDIIILLNRDFLKCVVIEFVVATPLSWIVVNGWLDNFAYHTDLTWWVFGIAGISALLIALFTVSWQIIAAASRNPVEALRYE